MDQENLDFNRLDNNRFSYLYFKLKGVKYEDAKEIFCIGKYSRISKHEYELHPDSFNPKSVDANINRTTTSLNHQMHIKVATDIYPDRSLEYRIKLISDSLEVTFNGLSFDSLFENKHLKKFTIEILLPDSYVNGHPKALFKSITTKPIYLKEGEFLNIKIPITLDYFYYQNIGMTKIKDMGNYYLLANDGKKIMKAQKIK